MPEHNLTPTELEELRHTARRQVLEMALQSRTAHIGPALSIIDILLVLYFRTMRTRPEEPDWEERDRFILSKGHGASALYSVLALRGYFPASDLAGFCVDGGHFHGHPCRDAAPGIEFSTGSLGHGLSVAGGIALGLAKTSKNKVFVLLGDGECNEGSVWEAAMFIATRKLNNVIAIVDQNRFQGFSSTIDLDPQDPHKKWEAFGWNVLETNGHDLAAIEERLGQAGASDQPTVILANTVSGKGMKAIEDTLLAHYFVPDQAAFDQAIKDIYAE